MPRNAIKEVYTAGVPKTDNVVIALEMDGRSSIGYKIANIGHNDINSSVTIKLQDSADGVSYDDVGTADTIVPGGAIVKSVASIRPHFRFWGSGGNEVQIEISLESPTHLKKI